MCGGGAGKYTTKVGGGKGYLVAGRFPKSHLCGLLLILNPSSIPRPTVILWDLRSVVTIGENQTETSTFPYHRTSRLHPHELLSVE